MKTVIKVLLFVYCLSGLAVAQEMPEPLNEVTFQKAVNDMNRLKPLQNPKLEKGKDVLKRNVIDNTSKSVGRVQDILIDLMGTVQALQIVFDRLHLSDAVYINYENMGLSSMADGYRIGLEQKRIADLYTNLPRDMASEAGDKHLVSINAITGLDVKTTRGRTIGKVRDILFNEKADFVEGVYIDISYKTTRDTGAAVPFSALQYNLDATTPHVVIDEKFSDIVLGYLE